MNKILVEINVPIAQKTFEIFLPAQMLGFDALPLIIKSAEILTDGIFMASEETILSRKDDGSILDLNLPVWRLDIKNGDKLILI